MTDALAYQLGRLREIAPLPLGLAVVAALSLVPWPRYAFWIRRDLSAVYLPITLLVALILGINFSRPALAENVVGGILVLFGFGFCGFRFTCAGCRVTALFFAACFVLPLIFVVSNLVRHYQLYAGN